MNLKIIGGSSHPNFTQKVCEHIGVSPTPITSIKFSNDNRFVKIEEPVRGDDVFVIQTQANPVNSHVMELLIILRALKNASAARITAVCPYFPYARSDKKDQPRVCITARLMADLLESAGADRVLIMEMHSPQLQGFFSVPCDHLIGAPEIVMYLKQNWNLDNYILVGGDAGAAKMIKTYADGLHLPVAIMDKRRDDNDEQVRIKGVIGDVRGKKVLIIDDETSSGDTLIKDAEYLLNYAGAQSVDACVVHPALSPDAAEKLNRSPIKRILTTDTIPIDHFKLENVEVVSVAQRFAQGIQRIHANQSFKSLNDLNDL